MTPPIPENALKVVRDGQIRWVDPNGHVYSADGKFIKTTSPAAFENYRGLKAAETAEFDLESLQKTNNILSSLPVFQSGNNTNDPLANKLNQNSELVSLNPQVNKKINKPIVELPYVNVDNEDPYFTENKGINSPRGQIKKGIIKGKIDAFNSLAMGPAERQKRIAYIKEVLPLQYEAELEQQRKKGILKKELDSGKLLKIEKDFIANFQNGQNFVNELPTLSRTLDRLAGNQKGPIVGRLIESAPGFLKDKYFSENRSAFSQLALFRQNYGKYMEGGVLRKEDEIKYKEIFPKLTDSENTMRFKTNMINYMLIKKYNSDLEVLKQFGYDTKGKEPIPEPEFPSLSGNEALYKKAMSIRGASRFLKPSTNNNSNNSNTNENSKDQDILKRMKAGDYDAILERDFE